MDDCEWDSLEGLEALELVVNHEIVLHSEHSDFATFIEHELSFTWVARVRFVVHPKTSWWFVVVAADDEDYRLSLFVLVLSSELEGYFYLL